MWKLDNLLAVLIVACAFFVLTPSTIVRAADHGDAPNVDNDAGADIADLFMFRDPNDNTKVILIGTVHGFIVPGEAGNFGAFDPSVQYRFDLEQTGDAKPDASIIVTFSERTGGADPQTATITLPGKGNPRKRRFTAPTTPVNFSATATPQTITTDPTGQIKFFAGEVSDPFFFDIPAFQRFIASVQAGSPDATVFSRGRNSFAGYNVLGIAFSFPMDMIRGASTNNSLGVQFVTSRRTQTPNTRTGGFKSTGAFKQVDRMGNPAVNTALIPFAKKSLYNASSPVDDAKGKFAPDIEATLTSLGTDAAHIGILASVAVTKGDYLRLDLTQPNTGPNGGTNTEARYPNGRRLADDTIDIILTLVANGTPAPNNGVATGIPGLLGDNVDAA
ncbi:MAG TPA: DUF4331 family protein, partial [Humisphaera sp.]|nr:DUF4331 family protein [Humisphaera sp.]